MKRLAFHRAVAFALAFIMTFSHVPFQDVGDNGSYNAFAAEAGNSEEVKIEEEYLAASEGDESAGLLLSSQEDSGDAFDDGISEEDSSEGTEVEGELADNSVSDLTDDSTEADTADTAEADADDSVEAEADTTDTVKTDADDAAEADPDDAAEDDADDSAEVEADTTDTVEAAEADSDDSAEAEADMADATGVDADNAAKAEMTDTAETDTVDAEEADADDSADTVDAVEADADDSAEAEADTDDAAEADADDSAEAEADADDSAEAEADVTDAAETDADDVAEADTVDSEEADTTDAAKADTDDSAKAEVDATDAAKTDADDTAEADAADSTETEADAADSEEAEAEAADSANAAGDGSDNETESEAVLFYDEEAEEAGLMEDVGYTYNYEEETSTLYINLNNDFNEDIVVLDSLTDRLGDRLHVILDLNGYTLRPIGKKNHTGITVFGMLTIRDGSDEGSGKVDGTGLSNVRGIEIAERGVLRLEGGTICNFHSGGNGAGITINKGGRLVMAGGSIVGNVSDENGGGIFAYEAHSISFEKGDRENIIAGNKAKNGGGIAFATTGTKEKTESNEDEEEDEDNVWEMSHVTLYLNRAEVNGGGLYFDEGIEAEMNGLLLTGNIAAMHGGAAYFRMASTLTLNNTRIAGNTAETGNGGAVHMAAESSKFIANDSVIGVDVTAEEEEADGDKGEDAHADVEPLSDSVEYGADKKAVIDDPTDSEEILSAAEESAGRGNLAEASYGGAIYLYRQGQIEFNRSALSRNMAYSHGGGFYLASENNKFSSFKATGSRFERNVLDGLVTGNRLGATGWIGRYATIDISDSLFRKNRGASHGSGLYIDFYNRGITIVRTNFEKNHYGSSYMPNAGYGAGMYIEDSSQGEMLLEDCKFLYNRADTDNCGSAGVRAGSTPKQLVRCEFIGNRSHGSDAGGSFGGVTEMTDCLFEGNESWYPRRNGYGGGFTSSGSKLTLKGNTVIRDNYCSYFGGGFYASNTEIHLESGVRILNNRSANHGGGFLASDGATTYLHDGVEITGNTSGNYGGGFYSGYLVMDGGLVSGNTSSSYGGGIYVDRVAEISGGEISGNTSNGNAGGLALGMSYGNSFLSGGRIVNNVAKSSCGGVQAFMHQRKSYLLTITGDVEISGNLANNVAGGLGLTWNPHCIIEGDAKICDNTALSNGGGVYLDWPGDKSTAESNPPLAYEWGLHIKGGQVYNNHSYASGNDLYTYSRQHWNYPNNVRTNFLLEAAEGGAWYDEKNETYITIPEGGYNNLEENAIYEDPENEDGDEARREKKWDGIAVYNYFTYMKEVESRAKILETEKEYPSVQAAFSAAEDGQTVVMLMDSVENTVVPEGRKLTLDLAGHALRAVKATTGTVITVENNAEFTLKDTSEEQTGMVADGRGTKIVLPEETGKTYPWNYTFGGGLYVKSGAKFTLESGTITNNKASYGGGVYLQDEAEMLMTGGLISSNNSVGVYVFNPNELWGDPVKDNASYYPVAGMNYWSLGAKFTMTGGEISGNVNRGIAFSGASSLVTISEGALITKNNSGGGVAGSSGNGGTRNRDGELNAQLNFVMDGGEIVENTGYDGTGCYFSNVVAEISGGSISRNTCDSNTGRRGGGIYIVDNSCQVTLKGNVVVTGNTSGYGGGICVNGATAGFLMEGGAVYGNKIINSYNMRGTDIYLYKGAKNVSFPDAGSMVMPEGEEPYNCWRDEVSGAKYDLLSEDIPSMEDKTRDNALCLIAERDTAILSSARIGEAYFPTLQAAVNAALAVEGEEEPVIYLLRDLKESVLLSGSSRNLTIDLNGYDIHCDRGQVFFLDRMEGTLTVRSTVEEEDARKGQDGQKENSGCILGNGSSADSESMRAVTITGGHFVLEDGVTIKDFHCTSSGGAVSVFPSQTSGYYNGSFTMKPGSRISDCSTNGHGGAVYASFYNNWSTVSKIIIEGGIIENCYAKSYGGAICGGFNGKTYSEDKFEVRVFGGSKIRNNRAESYGGGIYVESWNNNENTLEDHQEIIQIYDAEITGNRSENSSGGGIYLWHGYPEIGRADVAREKTLISGNWAQYDEGGLCVNTYNATRDRAFLSNVTIKDNEAGRNYGGACIVVPSVIEGCLIENNKASRIDGNTGGIYLSTPASDDESLRTVMRDTVVKGNSARYCGGMELGILANGSLFENVQILENDGLEYGGGLRMGYHQSHAENTKITFNNCVFKDNIANYSAAMWMCWWKAAVELHDCEVSGNISRDKSSTGGVGVSYNGTPNMEQYGTLILSGNTDIHDNVGRGVSSSIHTIIKDNVQIRNNDGTGNGGGLYQSGGWMELLGGTIRDNTTTVNGGGVWLYYEWNVANVNTVKKMSVLDGTAIYGNKANYGGGVFVAGRSTLTMKSGTIHDNEAKLFGGGVYVEYYDTLFQMDNGQIYNNNATYGKDVYGAYHGSYRTSEVRLIKAADMFLDDSEESAMRKGICWIDERIDRTIDDKIQGVLAYNLPLTLNFQTVKPSAAVKRQDGDNYIIYNSVQDAIAAVIAGEHGSFSGAEKPEVILVDDVSENVQIPGAADLVLNLNGYTLRGNGTSAISCYGDVRIIDEKKTISDGSKSYEGKAESIGTITGTSGQAGGGVHVVNGGTATLSSGQISGCSAGAQVNSYMYGGSGVCVDSGTFILEEGGAIRKNTVYYYGAAVLVRNGSGRFVMNGGLIEENTSTAGYGIILNYGGNVRITGGKIRNNTVGSLGTIFNYGSGVLNIGGESAEKKVEITDNTVAYRGGALFIDNGTVYLSNVLMKGNVVTCARQNSVNAVNGSGGAIYQGNGALYINEGTEIRENKAARGGGIYQNYGNCYMMGGLITDNTAELGGGIAQYPLNTMNMIISKGKVAGNHTTLYGSGNDIYSWYEGKDGKFDHPELVKDKPKLTIIPAEQMGDEAYNAWKDDVYKGTTRTAPTISNTTDPDAGGQYITGSVLSSTNLQLTAAYYDTEVEREFDSDVYIQNFHFQAEEGKTGSGIADGTANENAEIVAREKRAKEMEGAELVTEGEHAGMYLYNGAYYEPDQMAEWVPGSDGSTENLLVRSFDSISYSFLVSLIAQKGADSGKNRVVHPWIEITLPCDTTEAEFDMSSVGKIFKGAPSFNIREVDGKTVQTISGYWEQEMKDAENVIKSFSIKIYAMKNGDTLKPHFRAFVEGNEENETSVKTAGNGTDNTGNAAGNGDNNTNPADNNNTNPADNNTDPADNNTNPADNNTNSAGKTGSSSENASGSVLSGEASLMADGDGSPATSGGDPKADGNPTGSGAADGKDGQPQEDDEEKPVTEFDSPVITISAAPKYNAAIDYNSHLGYDGYFDIENGTEVSEEDYLQAKAGNGRNIVHGMMVGYGIMVSLYNDNATDGLKGIELPDKSLEFDVSLKGKLYYNGNPLFGPNSQYAHLAEGTPIMWAYKENMNTPGGKPMNEVNIYSRSMDWNDEDDVVKDTRFAYDAAPFNSGGDEKSCYSGGSWLITGEQAAQGEKELSFHVAVSNYVLNGDSRPNQTSDGVTDRRFNTPQVKPFTAGYVQVLFPYDEEAIKEAYRLEYNEYIGGYVAVGMEAAISHFNARGKSGRVAFSNEDPTTAGLEMLNTYYEKADPVDLLKPEGENAAIATCEMRYGDNYSFNDFARYIYDGSGGPRSSISKTAYFLTGSRGTLTGSEGKGSTPINSTVYAGGTVSFSSRTYHTDDITDPYRYIDGKDFNTNTDNLVEYDYMTAMNLLQKFDAEVYHPAYMSEYIDKEFTSNAQVNNSFSGKARDKKTNVQPFQIVTSEAQAEWDTVVYNKPMNYRLSILYAAKPDNEDGTPGGNWVKIYNEEEGSDDGGAADMDKYHEENMLYFRTLQELEDSGRTCVAILFEFRDMAIRTGRSVSVNTYLDVTDDFTKTGNTYITTNDARAWATYRRFYKETWRKPGTRAENMRAILYNYSYIKDPDYEPYRIIEDFGERMANRQRYGEDESSEGAGDSLRDRTSWTRKTYTKSDPSNPESETVCTGESTFKGYTYFMQECHKDFNGYKKTQYKNGVRVGGTHNGWDRGNVLLLYTLDTSIVIGNTDIPVGSNDPQTTYNVSKGERIVNYRVKPEIHLSSGATSTELVKNGSQSVRVTIELEIPKGLSYKQGSINYEYDGSGYTADQMEWDVELSGEIGENGTRLITLSTYVNDIEKKLPMITFACDIGNMKKESEDVVSGQALNVIARIYAEYQEIDRLAAEAHTSGAAISIIKDGNDGIKKDVDEVLVEIGEDIVYTLQYMNGAITSSNIRFGDVLPYKGDKRSTNFTGAYRVSGIDISFSDKASYYNYLGMKLEEDGDAEATQTGGSGNGNGSSASGSAGNPGSPDENQESPIRGGIYYKTAQTVPQKEDDQKALMNGMKTATELKDGENGVSVEQFENGDEELGIAPFTVRYTIDSDTLLLQKASTQNGNAIYGFFPNLSGTGTMGGEKQGVVLRIVLSSVSKDLAEDNGHQFLTDGAAVQTGGNKYTNNFIFCSGSVEDSAENVLRSSNVSVTTVGRTISGKVWLDKDHDDYYVSTGNDSLMKNVDVKLWKWDPDTQSYSPAKDILNRSLGTLKTNDKGEYSFNNLAPGEYKVEISDPDNDYVSKKDEWTGTPRPLNFNELALTKQNDKAANTNRGIYAGSEAVDPGNSLVARTRLIRMPLKNDIGGALFVSGNWNFGLYYMYPVVEKDWMNMVFAPSEGTVLSLTLQGTIDYQSGSETPASGDAGTEGAGGEKVYENVFTMKASGLAFAVSRKGLGNWAGGTFVQTLHTPEAGGVSYPWYSWTVDLQNERKLPLPVMVYRDGKAYDVHYSLSEDVSLGTTDKESAYTMLVQNPVVSEDGAVLGLKAVNTRYLSGFEFTKVDSRTKKPIIEVDPETGEKIYDHDLQDVTFKLYRSRSDADVVDPTYPGVNPAHADRLAERDVIPMIRLEDGSYRPKRGGDSTGAVNEMTITQNTGKLAVSDLPAGAYWLMETAAQDGYALPGGYWKILILPKKEGEDKDSLVIWGSVKSQPMAEEGTRGSLKGETAVNDDSDIKKMTFDGTGFRLTNKPGLVMARTGGRGSRAFLLLGLCAILAGAAGLLITRRRRRAA